MVFNTARIRVAVVLFILASMALSCGSPIPASPTVQSSTLIQEKSYTIDAPIETATIAIEPSDTPTITPTSVPVLHAKLVSAGDTQSCAVTLTDGVKCWGNYFGNNPPEPPNTNHAYPLDVPGLESGVKDISATLNFTCVLMISGGVKCWGTNLDGQLGDNHASGDYSYVPVDVEGLSSGVKKIAAGWYHICALLDSGAVKCWGSNGASVLGNNTYWAARAPTDVTGLSSGVIDIAAGPTHNCALMITGGVKCWGAQGLGLVLGSDYDPSPYYSPVDVKGLSSGAVAIAAGKFYTCALMKDSGVKCWGASGSSGVLGDGTKTDRRYPIDVVELGQPVIYIDANQYSVCVLLQDGSIKCWGLNLIQSQITEYSFSLPTTQEGFTKKITRFSVGLVHACAVMEDSTVMCWGDNSNGQLGLGARDGTSSHVPTVVLCPDYGE
jgi:alpha-tubulin suppressor-like RCC1 family protein